MSYNYGYRRGFPWLAVLIGCFIFLAVAGCAAYPVALRSSAHYTTFTVDEKERGTKDTPYLIYTDQGVYSVEDSIWFGDFRASDRYNELDVGSTYRCNIAGWRFGLLSMYPNIIGPCSEA